MSHEDSQHDGHVKKMARFLREGAAMLDMACPICKNPLFKLKNGERACVVCERKVLLESEITTDQESTPGKDIEKKESREKNKEKTKKHENIPFKIKENSWVQLRNACIEKMAYLSRLMNKEEDTGELLTISRTILNILEIMKKLAPFVYNPRD